MDRPRRSTRPSARAQTAIEPSSSPPPAVSRSKRKTRDALADPETFLHFILKNPKSPLTTMDITDLVNAASWNMLSPESQDVLKSLLPPTAFVGFKPSIDPDHPCFSSSSDPDAMAVDPPSIGSSFDLDISVFTDPHFLAAGHTLQDHIYSDWMSDAHAEKVQQYQWGIRDGTLSAAWKDEVWERNNASRSQNSRTAINPSNDVRGYSARAGEAAEVKLVTLAKQDVLRVGDVIAYKRTFATADLVIEKDAIIQSIHPKTNLVTVLFPSGTTQHLHTPLLLLAATELDSSTPPQPEDQIARILSATISSPTMLETALLDTDARIEKARRPNGNAWKCFTVYRWRGDEVGNVEDGRGGRESHGTLFYLRGTYYHERSI